MRFAKLLLLSSLTGCGARTALDVVDAATTPDIAAVDAARADTATIDAPSRTDVTVPVDAPTVACSHWLASRPLAITNPDRDRAPLATRVLDDRVWIGYQSSNPEPAGNQAWFVTITDALGAPVVSARQVLPSPGELQGYGPLSLWTDPVTRTHAAMAWDEGRGCNLVRLSDDASPRGAPIRVASEDCASVAATSGGWSLLTREASGGVFTQMHVTDGAGRELSSQRLPQTDELVTTATRLVFSDGTFLYAWATGGTAHARRFDANGRSMSRGASLFTDVMISALRLVEQSGQVVLGWSGMSSDGASRISLTRVTRDGEQLAPTVSILMPGPRLADWGLAVNGPDLAILWNSGSETRSGQLTLATFDARTLDARGRLDVSPLGWPHQISLRATSRGFVGVFGALPDAGLTEVWTISFRCDSR